MAQVWLKSDGRDNQILSPYDAIPPPFGTQALLNLPKGREVLPHYKNPEDRTLTDKIVLQIRLF